jgi:hypothetical protein
MGLGRYIGQKLHSLRNIGQKVAHGVRVDGNKLGGWMLTAAAPVAAFNPVLGAGIASAGGISRGIGGIAGGVEGVLDGKGTDLGSMKGHAATVRSAYGQMRGPGSMLERGGG